MWNNTDIPLAYLITFRCYGSWLHGDERGSIDRFHNQYKSPYILPNEKWQQHSIQNLKSKSPTLNLLQRELIEKAVAETCSFRNWRLFAKNVRTNHIHTVVSAGTTKPELVLNAFKANGTRLMRQNDVWHLQHSPWADKGSKRYLWNERSLEIAVDYVLNRQGDKLPDSD
jgi:REP element-mobilizing transposase RayT